MQTLNYDLTKAYLDLVIIYMTLMILLSRVEDRKAVLGLFNAAYEMVHQQRYSIFCIQFSKIMPLLLLLSVVANLPFFQLKNLVIQVFQDSAR